MNCAVPVLRLRREKVLRAATKVLGDEATARAWMKTPQPALDGAVPEQLVDTEDGLELVLSELASLRSPG